MARQMFTATMTTMISQYVKDFLLSEATVYRRFQKNGLIRKIPPGQDRWRYFDEKNPGRSNMASDIHDATIISPMFGETDVHLLYLVGKIVISKNDQDKFRSGTYVSGDLLQRTIKGAVRTQLDQVEQFILWGDEMQNPVSVIDAVRGQGVYTGILNGGTAQDGGDGADNNMGTNGDYVSTLANLRDSLRAAHHNAPDLWLISDPYTEKKAFQGNHYLSNTGSTEYARVLNDYPWLKNWIATQNCYDYSKVKYRMALVQPKQRTGSNDGAIVNTMELIMGYQFEITPVGNGGLTTEGNYEAFLETSLALVEYWATANQRTNTLAFT